ncbi:MAG: enoyl-CoA hydratase/isomerase family protein [Gammaproteobacteria bacterium]|nr:enoyl-CoA hydratase/isomerase family protein [Gammaproteobacteria bacterium]
MNIQISDPAEGIRQITLARPPANALSPDLLAELNEALDAAVKEGTRTVVIAGQPGMFSAGLDVPLLLGLNREEMARFWGSFFDLLARIARSPIPVGFAITGHCPAGGTVLSLYGDYRIAAAGDFKLGLNEVQVGLPMPPLIFHAFRRLVGAHNAEQLGVAGQLVSPQKALEIGLVDSVVPPEEVVQNAIEHGRKLASLPPQALAATRELARADLAALFDDLQRESTAALNEIWFAEETQAAMRALIARIADKGKARE